MAKYAISQEGADAMRHLASKITSSSNGVKQASTTLKTQIMGFMDDLGEYGPEIWAMTIRIDRIIEERQESFEELAENARKKSDIIMELMMPIVPGGGEKHLASEEPRNRVLTRDNEETIAIGMNAIDAQMDAVRDDCKDRGITDQKVIEEIVRQKREAAEITFYNDLYGSVESNTKKAFERISSYFSENTWAGLDRHEREDALNTLAIDVGVAYRTDIKGVVFFDGPSYSRGYYNGDGFLYLNSDCLSDPQNRLDALDTIFHEGRHAFQQEAITDPHRHGITEAQARIWADNFRHYLTSERFGYDRYYNQPVEADAFSFAENIIKSGGIK